jgi:DNA (cytosine-5)-methyltransferase 1
VSQKVPRAYYNEFDAYAAAWLRNLIAEGLIPDGDVDERSIVDVRPDDLAGYTQVHFFAGIGGWAYAARLAGWPDDRPLWTGSCPCQPFSSAARGRNTGVADPKHLWPAWLALIKARRPTIVFGEQVAAARAWLDHVCDGLEDLEYAVWAAILPACSVKKDHVRDRIYFAGYTNGDRQPGLPFHAEVGRVPRGSGHTGSMAGANGVPARVGRLRAFGNAIVPQVAAEVIGAWLDAERIDSFLG